ncbi:hypothetical protein D8M04_18015 [Oceanobacillus piezotolerans]|uniref:Uncharacterized protein n=1 Tax=Oceanobacillus piezotolerans TaxID=2448030 RepID=A0A498D218_9BACI|nr:hypothetical protein D8M04_18015 [Oceanobacillus piezotolerans]
MRCIWPKYDERFKFI